MLKFFFYLFIGYIIYSWIKLIFSGLRQKNTEKKQAREQEITEGYFQKKRKKMEDELSEYVDYQEIK
jgi:hypothetical protein